MVLGQLDADFKAELMELGKQNLAMITDSTRSVSADSAVISSLTVTENEELLAKRVVAMKQLQSRLETLISQKQKIQESVTATSATAETMLKPQVGPQVIGAGKSIKNLKIALKALEDSKEFKALDSEEEKQKRRTEGLEDILKPFYTQKEHELGNISL